MPAKKPIKKKLRAQDHEIVDSLQLTLRQKFRVAAGERVGIGVSGGADSVALLRLFAELRGKLGIVPCVVHFNHQLRGKASDADEKFVAQLAARQHMEFFTARENVAAKAKRERANLEDAARRARYASFEQLAKEGRLSRIAVAHTADDQAETVLAHILRGTGLAGLAGIHPQSGSVFRPLLSIRRAALRAYLRAKGQAWREDATNRDTARTRSRIRHQLLPVLEKKFNAAAVEHLCQLAELAREDNAHLEHECESRLVAKAQQGADGIAIPIEELTPSALAKRMIRQLVLRVKPRSGELGAQHVDAVLHLAQCGHSGKILQLPGGVEVRRERESLRFRPRSSTQANAAPPQFALTLSLPAAGQELRLDAVCRILHLRVIDWPSEGRETKSSRATLDADRLGSPVVLRNWRPGDAMRPVGHQRRHTLARLLNELGRTRWEKQCWPVLTSAGKVAWALGLPAGEEFAVTEGSRTGMVITEESLP